jgi:hypothetical protein
MPIEKPRLSPPEAELLFSAHRAEVGVDFRFVGDGNSGGVVSGTLENV